MCRDDKFAVIFGGFIDCKPWQVEWEYIFSCHQPITINCAALTRSLAYKYIAMLTHSAREVRENHIRAALDNFRHWRATHLVNVGQPLDVVQDYLGHKSVETTRRYYAWTNEARVDDAARDVGL